VADLTAFQETITAYEVGCRRTQVSATIAQARGVSVEALIGEPATPPSAGLRPSCSNSSNHHPAA
jgi:hypothetical protein